MTQKITRHIAAHDIPKGSTVGLRKADGQLVIAARNDNRFAHATELLKEGATVIVENGLARTAKKGE